MIWVRHDMLSDVNEPRIDWGGVLCVPLFAVAGLLGAGWFLDQMKGESYWVYVVPALPFAIACAFLCLRPLPLVITAAVLYCVDWAAALRVGARLSGGPVNQHVAMLIAGFIGGVGVAAVTSLDAPRLRTRMAMLIAGVIGGVFGLPFALYVKPSASVPLSEEAIVRISFALWQAAVGTYVYWVGVRRRATSAPA